jgi:hypothetical protein
LRKPPHIEANFDVSITGLAKMNRSFENRLPKIADVTISKTDKAIRLAATIFY